MEPKIIFEDNYLMVLDKPSGLTVNKSDTTKDEKTVKDWVENHIVIPQPSSSAGRQVWHGTEEKRSDFFSRAGIVHRLDKETSGILIVAKTPDVFENLQKQFKNRRVKKVYVALVHGKVFQDDGEIRVPLGRLPWNRERFGIVAGGRDSVTRYKVIFNFQFSIFNLKKQEILTLLELYPETGRTHQIRVHLKHIGHPIFSDLFYAGRKTARQDRKILPRLFLHAAKISFNHPKTNEPVSFEGPLPPELQEFLSRLHKY